MRPSLFTAEVMPSETTGRAVAIVIALIAALLLGAAVAATVVLLTPFPAAAAQRTANAPADSVRAPAPALPPVHAVRLTRPITLDGMLEEAVWREAPAVTRFTQSDPVEGAAPSESTEVRVAYDDEALYVGARFFDSAPESVVARLARKDYVTTADRFMIYIDSYHDHRTGFYFGVNAAGSFLDGTLLNDSWDDGSWDGVWDARARRDDRGWTAEVKIPFSQLRVGRTSSQVWGINFRRVIARRNESDFVTVPSRTASGFVSKFSDLVGLENLAPPHHLALLPYATQRTEFVQHEAGDPFHDGSRLLAKTGGDLKLGLGGLMLDATVNPDFGQVEVDPAVVNLSDLETYYPEKRPFFLEGDNVFRFGNSGASSYWGFNWFDPTFFYTRRIGRAPGGALPDGVEFRDVPIGTTILGAAKLTGRLRNGWSLGTLHAVTSKEEAKLASGPEQWKAEVEPQAYYGVLRAQRGIAEGRHGIGFISTLAARDLAGSRLADQMNRAAGVAGLDGWTFLDRGRTWVVSGYAAASRIEGTTARITDLQRSSGHYFQRPDAGYLGVDSSATTLEGGSVRLWLNKEKGRTFANAAFGFQSPGYDLNDMGFFGYGDVINGHAVGGYKWPTPHRLTKYADWGGAYFRTHDFGRVKTVDGYASFSYIEFKNSWTLNSFVDWIPERLTDRQTRGGPRMMAPRGSESNFTLATDPSRQVVWQLYGSLEEFQQGSSDSWSLSPTAEWRPGSNLRLSLGPEYSRTRTAAQYVGQFTDPLATATYGERYVFAALDQTTLAASLRLDWTFTPRVSLQLYAQPLVSAGDYRDFKELARPRSYDFLHYGQDGSSFDPATLTADPDGAGPAPPIVLDNPDFNFKSLRGSAILRWEYLPGSTLYVVWTQQRWDQETIGEFRLRPSLDRLLSLKGDNVFLVKLSYWWNV